MTDRAPLSRRQALAGLAGVAASAPLAGCTGLDGPTADDAGSGGAGGSDSLRYAGVLPPKTLDPVVAAEPWSNQVVRRVFQGLYRHDRDLNLRPVLAAGQPRVTDGGRRVTVELRPEARFQNGDPVTPRDVAYSFEAPRRERGVEAANAWQVTPVEAVRAAGDRTVTFRLRDPYPAFDQALTRPVVPEAPREAAPESFGEEPVGSGPYRVASFSPHGRAVLSAWDDYWGEASPGVARATFVGNHSGLARTMGLKTGQNDVVERVQPKLASTTRRMPHARVESTPGFHYFYVGFNHNDGPMAKPAVREAVDAVVDLDEVVRNFVEPFGERAYGPLPPRMAAAWGFPVERWRGIPRRKNTAAAKETFRREVKRSEDVRTGWQPTVAVPKHDMLREKVGETLVHGLKEAGFARARVKKYPWSSFRERVLTGSADDYDLFVGAWVGGPDPDAFLYPLFHERAEGRTNGTFVRDPSVMRALDRARATRDRPTRKRLYERAIERLLRGRAHLPAFVLRESFGVKERVSGFEPLPLADANPRLAGRSPLTLE